MRARGAPTIEPRIGFPHFIRRARGPDAPGESKGDLGGKYTPFADYANGEGIESRLNRNYNPTRRTEESTLFPAEQSLKIGADNALPRRFAQSL